MDLFKFLKGKRTESLEALLKKAADDPKYRIDFLKSLLQEKLVIITKDGDIPQGHIRLEKDDIVNVFSFEDGRIPVFTSTDRIFDKKIIKHQVTFLSVKGEDLFNLVKDRTFILNPYSDYGKELLPDEIENLLKGIFEAKKINPLKITKSTEVKIGQPAVYPAKIVKALNELFLKKPKVNAAYVAWIQNPATSEPPHYIFAIDTDEDWNSLIDEAVSIAKGFIRSDEIVDFMKIDDSGGINDYFINSTVPFYKK